MTMTRRRLMLAIGAAWLVGGWGSMQYAVQNSIRSDSLGLTMWHRDSASWIPWGGGAVYNGGGIIMALGAGLIGFAALRPTTRDAE